MNRGAIVGLAVSSVVSLAFGAAGCTCTLQGGAAAGGGSNAASAPRPAPLPRVAAPPSPAPLPSPASAPASAPVHVTLHDPQSNKDVPVPVIKGGNGFGDDKQTSPLRGVVYFIPEDTKKLPDLGALKPVAILYASQLNMAPRHFDQGFPGVDNRFEWFAIRYDGQFTAAKDGEYDWHILSDDGAIVWVDGNKILDNDGVHPPKEARSKVSLKAGLHTIRVDYFQGPRFDIALQLWVTPPGGAERFWSASF